MAQTGSSTVLHPLPDPPPVTEDTLREVVTKVLERCDPEKIYLFGSRAWGHPDPWSDIDILVVTEAPQGKYKLMVDLGAHCRPPLLPMDVIVRTPAEFRRRCERGDFFLLRIAQKGRLLYERSRDAYLDGVGRAR